MEFCGLVGISDELLRLWGVRRVTTGPRTRRVAVEEDYVEVLIPMGGTIVLHDVLPWATGTSTCARVVSRMIRRAFFSNSGPLFSFSSGAEGTGSCRGGSR